MNGVHDMGGMHGFGKIDIEKDEPVFHAPWEGRAYAMAMYTPVRFTQGFRSTLEQIPPALYLSWSYYEKWLHAHIQGALEAGVFTQQELDEKVAYFQNTPAATPPITADAEKVRQVVARIFEPFEKVPAQEQAALFEPGQRVRVKNRHPRGHTRLPGYCRGKQCVIEKNYGDWRVDDTPPPGQDHAIEKLYRVHFDGHELWGKDAEENQVLFIDMFESYLELA